LIVVIAVIAILAAVLLPRFLGFTDNARGNNVASDAKNIATAVEAIKAEGKAFTTGVGAAADAVYNDAEVMGYVGKTLGGNLNITDATTGTFTYARAWNLDVFTITYTPGTGGTADTMSKPVKSVAADAAAATAAAGATTADVTPD